MPGWMTFEMTLTAGSATERDESVRLELTDGPSLGDVKVVARALGLALGASRPYDGGEVVLCTGPPHDLNTLVAYARARGGIDRTCTLDQIPPEPGQLLYRMERDDQGGYRFPTYRFNRRTDHNTWLVRVAANGKECFGEVMHANNSALVRSLSRSKEGAVAAWIRGLHRDVESALKKIERLNADIEEVRALCLSDPKLASLSHETN